jgi:hypothetical protein
MGCFGGFCREGMTTNMCLASGWRLRPLAAINLSCDAKATGGGLQLTYKSALYAAVAAGAFAAAQTPASAQYFSFQRMILPACYDPAFRVSEQERGIALINLNQAIDAYAAASRSGGNLDDLYWGDRTKRLWSVDGSTADTRLARDPYAASTVRFELVQFVRANVGYVMTARWNAIGNDGRILATYDAIFTARARRLALTDLQLQSPARLANLKPLTTFCLAPGDIEKHITEKAARASSK